MGIFGSIMDKIFHHNAAAAAPAQTPSSTSAANAPGGSTSGAGSPAGSGATTSSAAGQTSTTGAAQSTSTAAGKLSSVDVDAVLSKPDQSKGGGGNWRTSIVDLLKLLDLDSSLAARKELGQELGVHAGADGSAEQNIALQKAVMNKLAENGGKVPDSLRN